MKKKFVIILTGFIFVVFFLALSQTNYQINKMSSGLSLSVEMALATHSCSGSSCHAYDINGTLKCDACCSSGELASCSRIGGCGCSPNPDL